MNTPDEQSFLQILRSTPLSDNENVQKELNVLVGLLEGYGAQSPSELKQKLLSFQKESSTEEKEKSIQEISQIYKDSNGNFTREQIKKILEIADGFKDSKELEEVIQIFEPDLEGRIKKDLIKAWKDQLKDVSKRSSSLVNTPDCENNPRQDGSLNETVTNDSTPPNQIQETNPPSTDNSLQNETAKVIEGYVRQAIQLRDEKTYELTDENISKIVELAKAIKKSCKVEGLKSFMSSLGINVIGVKNGELIDKIVYHFEGVALMRFKAVRMQEMK